VKKGEDQGDHRGSDPVSERSNTVTFMARAFHHRNYRLLFAGQGISLIGTWMQHLAVSWLIYRLTNSPFMLGFIGFIGQIPVFLFSSFAGVFVDRWNRHRMLLATQILATVQASLLAILTLTGVVAVWHVFAFSCFLGLINAVDMPTRQAFVADIVERREDLGGAIALNSAMFNGARLVGPSLAGLAVAAFGEGICFALNAVSFLTIILALRAMRLTDKPRKKTTSHPFEGFKEGYRYAFGFAPICYLLLVQGLLSLVGMPYVVLMPVFARDVLHGGPLMLGILVGSIGAGALIGALFLASRKGIAGLGGIAAIGLALFGCCLIAFSFSRSIPLSLALLLLTGFCTMIVMISCNILIQDIVDEDKRGRVMSLFAMMAVGMFPFGSFVAGSLASHIGAPGTVMVGGVSCIIGSGLFARKLPMLRAKAIEVYRDRRGPTEGARDHGEDGKHNDERISHPDGVRTGRG
jgi:MFS family permease